MPYIPQKDRDDVERVLKPANIGELNYLLSCWMRDYILVEGKSYANLSNAMAVVRGILNLNRPYGDCVYLYDTYINLSNLIYSEVESAVNDSIAEFYRRVVAPYEDKKIEENGDVYSQIL